MLISNQKYPPNCINLIAPAHPNIPLRNICFLQLEMKDYSPYFSSEDEYNKLIETIGIKNCNRIDFNQFLIMMAKKTQNTQVNDEKYLKKLFDALDKNHNGRISIHEIRYIVTHSNENLSEKDIEIIMKEADTDQDGYISFEEFMMIMKN